MKYKNLIFKAAQTGAQEPIAGAYEFTLYEFIPMAESIAKSPKEYDRKKPGQPFSSKEFYERSEGREYYDPESYEVVVKAGTKKYFLNMSKDGAISWVGNFDQFRTGGNPTGTPQQQEKWNAPDNFVINLEEMVKKGKINKTSHNEIPEDILENLTAFMNEKLAEETDDDFEVDFKDPKPPAGGQFQTQRKEWRKRRSKQKMDQLKRLSPEALGEYLRNIGEFGRQDLFEILTLEDKTKLLERSKYAAPDDVNIREQSEEDEIFEDK